MNTPRTRPARDVRLGDRVSFLLDEEANDWVTGKVVVLTLLKDGKIRILIELDDEKNWSNTFEPDGPVLYDDPSGPDFRDWASSIVADRRKE